MPLKRYGVLKGRPINSRLGTRDNAHYQVHVVDEDTDYRIAINVQSKLSPSELEYLVVENFSHPLLADLPGLSLGYHQGDGRPGGWSLDFIRGNLFDRAQMIPLPFNVAGPDNDLNDKIDVHIQRAISDENALIYAFGERWGPEPSPKDKIFGFLPGNGIHDIHMNQGNADQFRGDDGVWQDGGVIIHFPSNNQWVGIFLKFQSQTWHTSDLTGHRIELPDPIVPQPPIVPTPTPVPGPFPGEPDQRLRIIAAMVNPLGGEPETETVTLLNASPDQIDLTGWSIADRIKRKQMLSGLIEPGAALNVRVVLPVQLSNKGGIITLLDNLGLKVDGVAYTEEQADKSGWTIVF